MDIDFIWDSKYEIGVEEVDEQHQALFQLADKLEKNLNPLHAKQAIMALYKYTRIHFETEERVMREVGYPNYGEHVKLHEDLISTLNDISTQDFNSEESILELRHLVHDWLVNHISQHDLDIGRYVKSQS